MLGALALLAAPAGAELDPFTGEEWATSEVLELEPFAVGAGGLSVVLSARRKPAPVVYVLTLSEAHYDPGPRSYAKAYLLGGRQIPLAPIRATVSCPGERCLRQEMLRVELPADVMEVARVGAALELSLRGPGSRRDLKLPGPFVADFLARIVAERVTP